MTGVKNHQSVCRLAACAALLALSVSPAVASGPPAIAATPAATPAVSAAAATTAATVAGSVSLTLTSIKPAVAMPRSRITISGTVQNTGPIPIVAPVAQVLIGDRSLTSRGSVSDWAATRSAAHPVAEVARKPLGRSLAPGAAASFSVIVPETAISHRESFAVLPVSVDVLGATTGGTSEILGSQHTFLPSLSSVKAFEPLSIAWLVPLTLDPDAALHGIDGDARTAAWARAIGSDSRLDRVITGTDTAKVTWAVDPAILGPPQVAVDSSGQSPTPSPSESPSTTPAPGGTASSDPVTEATTTLANRLRSAAARHTLWSLPYADPDLAALLPLASGRAPLEALLNRPSVLETAVGTTRSGIAWPVDGTLSAPREAQLRAAYSSSGLAAAVISASTRTVRSGYTDDASRKSSGGLPLLAYDQALSKTFAQTSDTATGAITTQLFLADSLAMLGERPGTRDRSVLVVASRSFAGDPGVLGSFFAAIATARWLTPTSTDQLLALAGAAAPEQPGAGATIKPRTATPSPSTASSPPDPLSPGASPLTRARLRNISQTTSAIAGIASIRDDAQLFRARWTDAEQQLLSSRWRGHKAESNDLDAATQAAISAVSNGVRVVPSSVNFFADRGVLQVTVVNDLTVPVHDVHLTLMPGQPRLRVEKQPGPLRIGAKSRTNVRVSLTAVAAGLVPIEAVLTTPNGTSLGRKAEVNVRVQPPSSWIYWAPGGVAGVILVLGIYRSLRRGSTRASRPGAQEISFDE